MRKISVYFIFIGFILLSAQIFAQTKNYSDESYRYELEEDEGLFNYKYSNIKAVPDAIKAIELHHAIIAREVTFSDKFCDVDNGILVYTAIIPVSSSIDVMKTDFVKSSIVIHCTTEDINVSYKAGIIVGKPNKYLSRASMRFFEDTTKKMAQQMIDSLNKGYQESLK